MPARLLNTLDLDVLRTHPICRGEFVALVFSGSTEVLREIAGEATFLTRRKFALPDPRRDGVQDFAHHCATSLPRWPGERVEPIDGVCFIFDDPHHPALEALRARDAHRNEHFVIVEEVLDELNAQSLPRRLQWFLASVGFAEPVAVLGYGQQGSRISRLLVEESGLSDIRVIEHGEQGRRQARQDGFEIMSDDELKCCGSVIYTPLHHHHRLAEIIDTAHRHRLPVFDNRVHRGSAADFYADSEGLRLDASARRGLRWQGLHVSTCDHGFAVRINIIREDLRCLGQSTFPHLHAHGAMAIGPGASAVNLEPPSPFDPFAAPTFIAPRRVYVSLIEGAAPIIAAARAFCREQWPEATADVLPSPHPLDLGATSLERLLSRCIGRCEVAMASQTPAQQVALGVLARAYAADAPLVEIGSALGGSALLMAAATERHRPPIISIDPDTATRDVMRFIFEREGHLDRLEQRLATSDDAVGDLHHLRARAGLVFIDGLHTEEAARRDFKNYASLVRPGGALLFHDAEPAWQGVLQVVTRDAVEDRRFRLRVMIDSLAVFERLGRTPIN